MAAISAVEVAVGIDVAKATFDVAFIDQSGKARHKQFPNRPQGFTGLATWLKNQGIVQAHVCMEATGS